MGKRGPRPDPLALRIVRGTEKKRPRPMEPVEVSGEMVMPDWLGERAVEKWNQMIPILQGRNTYAPAYVDFLAAFCQAYEDMLNAVDSINANGGPIAYSDKTGAAYIHPATSMKYNAIERMAKFGREFGLSPTSIRDIQANKPQEAPSGKKRFFAS